MGHPRPLFHLFSVFSNKHQYNFTIKLQQINVKKCPSSIRRWDSNPRPSNRESPSIATRPGLFVCLNLNKSNRKSAVRCFLPLVSNYHSGQIMSLGREHLPLGEGYCTAGLKCVVFYSVKQLNPSK